MSLNRQNRTVKACHTREEEKKNSEKKNSHKPENPIEKGKRVKVIYNIYTAARLKCSGIVSSHVREHLCNRSFVFFNVCVYAGVFQLLFVCAVFVMLTLAALEQNYSVQVRDLIVQLFQHSQFTPSSWQGNRFLLVVRIWCHEYISPPLSPGSKFLSCSHDFMCCLESPTLGSSSVG